ncbi:MAG TPA: phosphatidylserine decarboxylase [Bacteriovoracaceae bacterium]|nr:phosphatidylserine decarboxylase [Bacteriovoracaceae bacterium]
MNRYFFLHPAIAWGSIFILVWTFFFHSFTTFFWFALFLVPLLLIYRRSPVPFIETVKVDKELILSPVFGTVVSIRPNSELFETGEIGHEVRIAISLWSPKGLYLPTSAEVTYLKHVKGKKIPLDAEPEMFYGNLDGVSRSNMTILSNRKVPISMRFIDRPYGVRPEIWLKSGDIGKGGACFGYYLFGGTLLMYLPKECNILVYENERVVPGSTVIASLPLDK